MVKVTKFSIYHESTICQRSADHDLLLVESNRIENGNEYVAKKHLKKSLEYMINL